MKKNWFLIGGIALLLVAAVLMVNSARTDQSAPAASRTGASQSTPAHDHSTPASGARAVREIPVTIAQLPCYCHCDKGFGHKSLYSCFEDDHAAHCAVCVNEALLALKLEKEQKLTPAQIRDTIVAQYSH